MTTTMLNKKKETNGKYRSMSNTVKNAHVRPSLGAVFVKVNPSSSFLYAEIIFW